MAYDNTILFLKRGDWALLCRCPVLLPLQLHPIMASNAFCSELTGAPHRAAKYKQAKNSWWMHPGVGAHHAVSNPSFSASVVCASMPCALRILFLDDCCVHPPPLASSCLRHKPDLSSPYALAATASHPLDGLTPLVALLPSLPASNSKLPLVCPGWLPCGLSSCHHLLMRWLVVVSPIDLLTLPLTVLLMCCHLSLHLQFTS